MNPKFRIGEFVRPRDDIEHPRMTIDHIDFDYDVHNATLFIWRYTCTWTYRGHRHTGTFPEDALEPAQTATE